MIVKTDKYGNETRFEDTPLRGAPRPPPPPNEFDDLNQVLGSGVGDWVKKLASPIAALLGKSYCTKCEAGRLVLNALPALKAKHGTMKAMSLFKELYSLSRTDPKGSVGLLKQYLGV